MANWYDNVPAPVDANGHEVPLGTQELMYRGETRGVLGITYSVALALWIADLADSLGLTRLSACTLPDSWELLEKDVAKDPCGYFDRERDGGDRCLRCPAYDSEACATVMAKDVVRRAKALAGVGCDV